MCWNVQSSDAHECNIIMSLATGRASHPPVENLELFSQSNLKESCLAQTKTEWCAWELLIFEFWKQTVTVYFCYLTAFCVAASWWSGCFTEFCVDKYFWHKFCAISWRHSAWNNRQTWTCQIFQDFYWAGGYCFFMLKFEHGKLNAQ